MKAISGEIRLSASDLSNHLACHHLTSLDLAVSFGARSAPAWHSPDAEVLQERGMVHENASNICKPGGVRSQSAGFCPT